MTNKKQKKSKSLHHIGNFLVVVHQEKKGYWVECPALEGCYSQGETIDEALHNIREAIVLCLEDETPAAAREAAGAVSMHVVAV